MDKTAVSRCDFNQLIAEHYDQLTKSEKRIATYMRQNQDEAASCRAAKLPSSWT